MKCPITRDSHIFIFLSLTLLLGCAKKSGSSSPAPGVNSAAPNIVAFSPVANASNVSPSTSIVVQFSEALDSSTVNSSNFLLSLSPAIPPSGPTISSSIQYNAANFSVILQPNLSLLPLHTYVAYVSPNVKDSAGNSLGTSFTWSFTTGSSSIPADTTAPAINSVSPIAGNNSVPLNSVIEVNFSEAIDALTLDSTSFSLLGPNGLVAGNLAYNGNNFSIRLTPASNLDLSTSYTATVTTGIKDLAGNALATNYSWSFVTTNVAPPPDTTPPTILSTTPGISAANVAQNSTVQVFFSEDLNPNTINSSSFSLAGPAGLVAGNLNYQNGNFSATFTPQSNLTAFTNYTATLTTAIQDLAGNSLGSNYSWSFTTISAGVSWHSPELLENLSNNATNPKIAIDSSGRATAVWIQANRIYANRFTPGTGWSGAITIDPGTSITLMSPKVVMDNNGNALAIWRDPVSNAIWSSWFLQGAGSWQPAQNIFFGKSPDVAINGNGAAFLIWNSGNCIYASQTTPGVSWGPQSSIHCTPVIDPPVPSFDHLQISLAANGNAIAIWERSFVTPELFASDYTAGVGWTNAVSLAFPGNNGKLAMNAWGNALVAWKANAGLQTNIQTSSFTFGSGWSAPVVIPNSTTAGPPEIAVDGFGNGFATWWQNQTSPPFLASIYTSSFPSGASWSSPQILANSSGWVSKLAADNSGNVMVVWLGNSNGFQSVWSKTYSPSLGWGLATLLENNDQYNADLPEIAIDPISGAKAIAVWQQYNGSSNYDIWANRFE